MSSRGAVEDDVWRGWRRGCCLCAGFVEALRVRNALAPRISVSAIWSKISEGRGIVYTDWKGSCTYVTSVDMCEFDVMCTI